MGVPETTGVNLEFRSTNGTLPEAWVLQNLSPHGSILGHQINRVIEKPQGIGDIVRCISETAGIDLSPVCKGRTPCCFSSPDLSPCRSIGCPDIKSYPFMTFDVEAYLLFTSPKPLTLTLVQSEYGAAPVAWVLQTWGPVELFCVMA